MLFRSSCDQRLTEPVEQKNPVGQSGQKIMLDHVTGMVFKKIVLADVEQYANVTDDFFVHIPNDFDCQVHRLDPLFPVFLAALFLALGASVAGYSLFNYAVSHAPMANVAVFHNLATIVSVAAGIFILGEKLTAVSLGAMVVVLIGIWGVQKYPPENEFEE